MTTGVRCLPTEARSGTVAKPMGTLRLASISTAVAAVLPLAFLVMGVLRAYPFVDDVSLPTRTPDDWHTYKQLALSSDLTSQVGRVRSSYVRH